MSATIGGRMESPSSTDLSPQPSPKHLTAIKQDTLRVPISASDSVLCANEYRDDGSSHNSELSGVTPDDPQLPAPLSTGRESSMSEISGASSHEILPEPPSQILEECQEATISRLQGQLSALYNELKNKEAKWERFEQMQKNADNEIHELSASLFQEAYKMVTEANVKRAHAEKLLKEANGKVDVLSSEVDALKILVVNSTPANQPTGFSVGGTKSKIIPHTPAGFSPRKSLSASSSVSNSPARPSSSRFSLLGHRRNNSDTPALHALTCEQCGLSQEEILQRKALTEFREVDPIYFREFTAWREKQDIHDQSHPFLQRVYREEILPCMNFGNQELAKKVIAGIEANSIVMEQINEERPQTRNCALTQVPRNCNFRLKTDNDAEWVQISQLARNRIASVCDFFTYLGYLKKGLVRCNVHEGYWEVVLLRKNMNMARLGLGFLPWTGVKPHK